jgi:thiaminase
MLDEILWQRNKHLAEACLHHPFVRGLADGTLYPEAFRRYIAQDAFFLNAFARAYALAAARSQDGETLISLCELLNGVLRELQLHVTAGNPYQQWITTYSGSDFQALVTRLGALLDSMGEDTSAVRDAYAYAMRCELNFFSAMSEHRA